MTHVKLLIALAVFVLPGCAAVVEYPMTTIGMGVWGVTGKGTTDHALNYVTGDDCMSTRLFTDSKVCQNGIDRQERAFAERKR